MNKSIRVLLTAAIGVVIGFGMASCADNIDNSTGPSDNPQEQQAADAQQEKALKFWNVVSQLVDVDDYTADYENKTFEPTYGVLLGTATDTRYVYTNTAAAAAERFADLVERDDIDENTQSYTYSDPDVGTLIYKKGTGRTLATVDVDIKQIPSLKKIVYMSGAYANGYFKGRAYYRFGDVVSRQVQGYDGEPVDEYWICVRPSFGPENKGESHWVCLNVLPKKNVWYYHSNTNGKDYYLPTGLNTNKEQMQNLAEMLYAMYAPDEWQQNVITYGLTEGVLKMFHDFDPAHTDYHNREFWLNVGRMWNSKDIFTKAFNTDKDKVLDMIGGDTGLHLLYSGYSWWTLSSWNCSLAEAIYANGNDGKEKNMHKATYQTVKKSMYNFGIDFRKTGGSNYDNYGIFFSPSNEPNPTYDNGDNIIRWTVRHATGKELSSTGRYNQKEPIDGVTEVYRYYRDVIPDADLEELPEETTVKNTADNAPDGQGTYLPGDVVEDQSGNTWFCLTGSAYSDIGWSKVTDKSAWFLSLDFKDIDTTYDIAVSGLPTEEELPELAYRLGIVLAQYASSGAYKFNFNPNESLGPIFQHIKDYAGVDWHKLIVARDSVFTFTSKGQTYNSRSSVASFCLAYTGYTGKQSIARLIIDFTQAGSERTHCTAYDDQNNVIGKLEDVKIRLYKHYETYNPAQMRQPTAVEATLGVNTWCLPWQVTQQEMALSDVTNQDLVNRYAHDDKWVTLPLTGDPTGARQRPRDDYEVWSTPRDYIGHYHLPIAQQKLSMFNEPVLFLRLMKVTDEGGKQPNLTSQDGRHLTVVHLQDDQNLYNNFQQNAWAQTYVFYRKEQFYIDNVLTQMPLIPGMTE